MDCCLFVCLGTLKEGIRIRRFFLFFSFLFWGGELVGVFQRLFFCKWIFPSPFVVIVFLIFYLSQDETRDFSIFLFRHCAISVSKNPVFEWLVTRCGTS